MNILFAAAEMSPLAKVGGLGDVAGSLPRALVARGADVRIALPFYATIDRSGLSLTKVLDDVRVRWPDGEQTANIWRAEARDVPVYLVENERFFGRPEVYGFDDDNDRFLFYCHALLASAERLDFRPDVVHAHDWHAAWLLARLAADEGVHPWSGAGRVYTIHNLGLQGNFDRAFADTHGLGPQELLPPGDLAEEIMFSAMALGIAHADRVNTVSDTYAREIMTPEYGAGLDPLLRARREFVSGIVNGIDYEEFNPATDRALAHNFDRDSLDERAANKRALQEEANLPQDESALVFGIVTRLWAQKGIDLVPAAFEPLVAERGAQLAILGTGDPDVHTQLLHMQERHPERVKVWLEFNPALGQRVYGGCDSFVMPSRYEPCGLGQMISLRYGAIPLVRRTGGLADTIEDGVTGFVFDRADAGDLRDAATRTLDAYQDRSRWRAMQERGMRQDWSWNRAAGRYLSLYEEASADRKRGQGEAAS